MSKSKWNPETIAQEALKYKTRKEFQVGSSRAYRIASKLKIIDEVCKHMEVLRKDFTYDALVEIVNQYNRLSDFTKKEPSAYNAIKKRGLMDDLCSHMERDRIQWTHDLVEKEALKYKTRDEFRKSSPGAYGYANNPKNNILDLVCSHMEEKKKPAGYWTPEKVREEALKYKSRSAFIKNSYQAYQKSQEYGIFEDICEHMRRQKKEHNVFYFYQIPNSNVYKIGISNTQDVEKRIKTVYSQFSNDNPTVVNIFTGDAASDVEKHFKVIFKNQNLSLDDFFELGVIDDSSPEMAIKKIDGRTEFFRLSERDVQNIMNYTQKKDLNKYPFNTATFKKLEKMPLIIESIWTYDKIKEVALSCKTRKEFYTKHRDAYDAACRKKIIPEVCLHLPPSKTKKKTHTIAEIIEKINLCNTKTELAIKYKSYYNAARRMGVYEELTSHMVMPKRKWNHDTVTEEASHFESVTDFRKSSRTAYEYARDHDMLNELFSSPNNPFNM